MFQINIQQYFNQTVDEVFSTLSDHQQFGELVGAKVVRIVDSQTAHINGLGSVRRISKFLVPPFEETIIGFEPNRLIEYTISKGSPIEQHHGRLCFSQEGQKTMLNYSITFAPKLAIPGWGALLVKLIADPIEKGLARYAGRA